MLSYVSHLLKINNLHVSAKETEIIKGLDIEIQEGEMHAIMGPNGSGKSTLVNTLMGHPAYRITKGEIEFEGKNILDMKTHERARTGMFLAFQHPKEIDGVTLRSFLLSAYNSCVSKEGQAISPIKFKKLLDDTMKELKIDPEFANRSINKGFSGGEKKKVEVLQIKILKPKLALLDETDSGLDIDALKIVSEGINSLRNEEDKLTCILVTHYARILDYVSPDHIHIMVNGKIVESGGAEVASKLEETGYKDY